MKEILILGWVYFLLEMKNFDRIINSFEVHIKSKIGKQVYFWPIFCCFTIKTKYVVLIQLGNNHNTVNCCDQSMNFVLEAWTLCIFEFLHCFLKIFKKNIPIMKTLLVNWKQEFGIGSWKLNKNINWRLYIILQLIQQWNSKRLHSVKECSSKHSHFFISLIVRLPLKLKNNMFIHWIFE